MKLVSNFKDKLEYLKIELFEYHNLMLIFPFYRKKREKWEKQNIRNDIQKLRYHRKLKIRREKLRIKRKEKINAS